MIGQKAGTLFGVQCFHGRSSVCSIAPKILEHSCRPATRSTQTASPGINHVHSRLRPPQLCRAVDRDIGGYTPSDYITWSEEVKQQCHHHAEVVVDAPVETCFALWMDWSRILDFLDLVGQIGLDDGNPDMALFQCFYRWRRLPILEIVFLVERTKVEPNKRIKFQTCYGMPMRGQVDFQELPDGQTKVKLYFTHGTPNLLVQLNVGPFGIETDLMRILNENLAEYKTLVEQEAPADWQEQKQQVATRVQQQPEQTDAEQPPAQQQREQMPEAAEPAAQQQQQQPEAAQASPAAGRKARTSRKTTAQAAEDATPQEAAAAAAAAEDAAPAADAPKSRGRSPTSRRTASKGAAAAAELFNSSSNGSRRSRSSTAVGGDGNGQPGGAGRPARRSSKRTTASK